MQSHIAACQQQSALSAEYDFENYVATQLPILWLPNSDYQVSAISTSLKGITAQDSTAHIYPETWRVGS